MRWDDPDSWVNPTPRTFADARPYVAAMIGKALEVTSDQDVWEFRLGKINEDEYRNDPFAEREVAEWYRMRGKDWKGSVERGEDWAEHLDDTD